MAGLGGLAFVGEGYQQGLMDFMKAQEAKDQVLGDQYLGKALMMLNGQDPNAAPGGFSPSVPSPAGGAGAPPVPGAGGPPGAAPIPGPGAGPAFTPQMTPGAPLMGVQRTGPVVPPQPQMPMGRVPPQAGAPPGVGGRPGQPYMAGGNQFQPMGPGGGGGGAFSWQSILGALLRANPGASPGGIAAAVNRLVPMMTAQSQMDWRQMQGVLGQERIDAQLSIAQGRQDTQEDIARLRTDTQTQIQGLKDYQRAQDRASREAIAAGRTPGQIKAFNKFLADNPDASPQEMATFLKSMRGSEAQQQKLDQQQRATESVVKQINSALADVEQGDVPVTGLTGSAQRYLEWGGGLVGADTGTRASDFQTKIRLIQNQLPRVIAGASRLSKEERAHLDDIIRGLGTFTNKEQVKSALDYVKQVILDREGAPPEAGEEQLGAPMRGGAVSGARPVRTQNYRQGQPTSTQEPRTLPPNVIEKMKAQPGHEFTLTDGTTWYIDQNTGQPVQVMNAR